MDRIKAINQTVHGYAPGIKALAEQVDCSPNLLYRAGLPGASNCDLGFSRIVRLVEVTREYHIIDYFCARFGFFRARPPRVAFNRMDENQIIEFLQTLHLGALQSLVAFFRAPSTETRRAADRDLYNYLGALEGVRKRLKRGFNQLELGI